MARTSALRRKESLPVTRKRSRAAKGRASKLIRAESTDSISNELSNVSLQDSSMSEEDVQEDQTEVSDNDEQSEADNDDEDTCGDVVKRRRSGRAVKPINDLLYTSSATSTPGKTRNMKNKRRKNLTFESTKKRKLTKGNANRVKRKMGEPLKVAGKPLPGRETEFQEISSKLSVAVRSSQGLCLYLSGVPGTGKTATVREVIGSLQQNTKMPQFDFVEINGMKLSDPAQVYPVLWRNLGQEPGDKMVSSHMALKHLKAYFSDSPRPVVVLLDELDALLQRKHSILYHFFEWTGLESAKLVIVAIANTMDLPERLLSNRISSRMGLNRLNFVPYHYSQLEQIILHRLAQYRDWFHVDALELCARKVSSVSGDARRAISFATRAVDHIRATCRQSGRKAPAKNSINMQVMKAILNSAFTGTPVSALKSCSGLQSIMLDVINLAWKHQLNVYDTTFYSICERFWQQCRNNNIGFEPSMAVVKSTLWSLASSGLVRLEPAGSSISVSTKIISLFTDEDLQIARKEQKDTQF